MAAIVTKPYVEQREAGYWIVGTRVSLDSVVYAFINGKSPESIVQSFPLLTLEQVYATITYYLHNKAEVDAYLERSRAAAEAAYQEYLKKEPSDVVKRMRALAAERNKARAESR